jgi:hypothetical protein
MISDLGGEMVRHKKGIPKMKNAYKILVDNTHDKDKVFKCDSNKYYSHL